MLPIIIVLLTDFGHGGGGQSQQRSVICVGDIEVNKCVRRHRFTLCSFTLIVRWGGNPTRPETDQAQDQRLNVLSVSRGFKYRQLPHSGLLLWNSYSKNPIALFARPGNRTQDLMLSIRAWPRDQRGSYIRIMLHELQGKENKMRNI